MESQIFKSLLFLSPQPALNSQLLPPHVAAQAASVSAAAAGGADETGGDAASAAGAAAASTSAGKDESMNQGSPSAGAS